MLFALHEKLRARGAKKREVFRHGFSAFLLFNLLTTYWVTNTGFGAGFFAMLANSALMCLPWMVMYWTSKHSPKIAILAFAACWVAFEHGNSMVRGLGRARRIGLDIRLQLPCFQNLLCTCGRARCFHSLRSYWCL